MSQAIAKLMVQRPWIRYIDDERGDGNSIIVTLHDQYEFQDDPGCGVQGYDTMAEMRNGTRKDNIKQIKE